MKLLLDTHIWLWSRLEPARLTHEIAEALENQENELWLSPVSIWELFVAARKGRIDLDVDVEEWIRLAFQAVPLKEAPMTYDVALETKKVQLPHRDPADLFLVATARVFNLTLVTADERI